MKAKIVCALVALSSAAAIAQPSVSFNTVYDSNTSLGSDGSLFEQPSEIVVGTGGDVFSSVALFNPTTGNLGNAVVYSTPAAGNAWNSQVILDQNTSLSSIGGSQLLDFANLALATNSPADQRLFLAADDAANGGGILQVDINSGTPTVSTVAFDGDGGNYTFNQPPTVNIGLGFGLFSLQVNASGQALFYADTGSGPSPVLVRGNASGLTQVTSTTGLFSVPTPFEGSRTGIGNESPTPSAVAQLAPTGTQGVYALTSPAPTLISGVLVPAQFSTSMIMGYTSNNTLNAALMFGQTPGPLPVEDVVVSKNSLPATSVLANGTAVSPSVGAQFGGDVALGQLSPQGKIALYAPDGTNGSGDTIQYADATSLLPRGTVVASIDPDPSGSPSSPTQVAISDGGTEKLPIIGLQADGSNWVPQINNGGTMVFNAEVLDPTLGDEQALLEWSATDPTASPTVLLETGEPADINGVESASDIQSFQLTDLVQESDFHKNAISDDGYIGVGVTYDDGSNAVLITQLSPIVAVPEPTTLALLPVAGMALFARRRRK